METKRSIIFVFATALIALGTYAFQQHDKVVGNLVTELNIAQVNAEDQALLIDKYEELQLADSLFHLAKYRTAITAYQDIIETDNEQLSTDALQNRIRHAQYLVNMRATMKSLQESANEEVTAPEPVSSPITAPVVLVNMEEPNSQRYDSLSFVLQKANLQINDLQRQLEESSSSDYLSFKSKKGNNIYYVGEIKDGKANGQGVALFSTGSRYFGEWKDNMKHGEGAFYWKDGAYYEGQYAADKRSGEGTYHFPKGDVFVGNWENDLRHGKGVFYNKKGKIIAEGIWEEDELLKRD